MHQGTSYRGPRESQKEEADQPWHRQIRKAYKKADMHKRNVVLEADDIVDATNPEFICNNP